MRYNKHFSARATKTRSAMKEQVKKWAKAKRAMSLSLHDVKSHDANARHWYGYMHKYAYLGEVRYMTYMTDWR